MQRGRSHSEDADGPSFIHQPTILSGHAPAGHALTGHAQIRDLRFHDLRHTAATRMADAGINVVVIAEILGHGDIRTTKRYAHAMDEAKREAVEKLAKSRPARQTSVKNEDGRPGKATRHVEKLQKR